MSLLLRHRRPLFYKKPLRFPQIRSVSTLPSKAPSNPDPRSNLSARLSFVFDQIDAIENRTSEKFDALQRIRQWRESRNRTDESNQISRDADAKKAAEVEGKGFFEKKGVELVHPWPEWIELMERLGQQNYFDFGRRSSEDRVAESVGIDLSEVKEEIGFDFSRDWTTVRNACVNFGKDRFDIFRSLSKKDLQILVGHGCPSMDPKVVFSAKLLRKHTHLDEGDVCSSCSLRNSCSRGYILTLKEDEARTTDVMRVLLTYGFDHVNGAVENKPLMQMKSVKTVVRKLLHEIAKLSAVPIDPNLPPPVVKKPPPKVKQPPPVSKKRVGRDDVEMKKGDWLCPKCDFMNFAKNTVCLQCDAKRPKRQLLPGEWECPQCNFLNYRRNMACFHCDAKRPPDEFTENQFQPKQPGLGMRSAVKGPTRAQDILNAWNFDFDDNESDGADVAAFEFADSTKSGNVTNPVSESSVDEMRSTSTNSRSRERGRCFSDDNERKYNSRSDRTGFDDFDDEEDDDVDSYEVDGSNNNRASDITTRNFSEIDNSSGPEDFDDRGANNYKSDSEEDDLADHPHLKSSHVAESWNKSKRGGRNAVVSDDEGIELDSDFDDDTDSGFGSKQRKTRQQRLSRKDSSKRGRGSDSEDELFLDLDSDGDDGVSYSSSRSMRGSNIRKSNDTGNVRRGVFRSDSRKNNRRNSFDDHDDERRGSNSKKSSGCGNSRRGDFSNQRNSFGDQNDKFSSRGRREENNRFEHFDRVKGDRSRGWRRDQRSLLGNGYNDMRGDDQSRRARNNSSSNFRDRSRSFGDGSNRFGDRSRGSMRDERSPQGNERNNASSNFRDRSRSFSGDNDNDKNRPRRRVIER